MDRPTFKELFKRLGEARKIVAEKGVLFVDPAKVVGELDALDVDAEEAWLLIAQCLNEIRPEHYNGSRPPQKSYEKTILGKELFAFSWESDCCGQKMYLKFVISQGLFYYVSLHRDRPEKKRF